LSLAPVGGRPSSVIRRLPHFPVRPRLEYIASQSNPA
jgi:hypothetical protein